MDNVAANGIDATIEDIDATVKDIEEFLREKARGMQAVDEVAEEFMGYVSLIGDLLLGSSAYKCIMEKAEGVPEKLQKLRDALADKNIFERYGITKSEFLNAGLQYVARFYSPNYNNGAHILIPTRLKSAMEIILDSSTPDLDSMVKFAIDYQPQTVDANAA